MEKADFLKKRAESFLDNARHLIGKRDYALAAFNLEQAAQLYIKYHLFLKLKDYPKTHSLKELLIVLGKAYQKESKVEEIVEKDINLISDLEQSYITSRYFPAEFTRTQVENMREWIDKALVPFLRNL